MKKYLLVKHRKIDILLRFLAEKRKLQKINLYIWKEVHDFTLNQDFDLQLEVLVILRSEFLEESNMHIKSHESGIFS